MHIKQITISGFKSYRDAIAVGPYSAGHNVVVGRNGSGKSNFFDAVRFVLSDTFSNLRAEERVALLHEGAGASVLSAYVEMVFDNSDGRLPYDRDEVALRRMVGLKKDEYVLDRKNVSRTEVFNLLESAGFSRSNPYYIVQQGKVAALCGMTDRQRLALLKEVAGTRVYDERREESLKIMDETDAKRTKIAEVVQYIESRLEELETEKKELQEFQKLDKDRRALEYTIHVKDLEDAKKQLDELDSDRAERVSRGDKLQSLLVAVEGRIASAESDVKANEADLEPLLEEDAALEAERKAAVDKEATLQVNLAEAEQIAVNAQESAENARGELQKVIELIETKEAELEPLEENFDAVREEEQTMRKEMAGREEKALALRVKADRVNQFSSVQERDAHLKKEARTCKKARDAFQSQLASAKKDVDRLERASVRNGEKLEKNEALIKELTETAAKASSELADHHKRRDDVHAQRQEIWRKEADIGSKIRLLEKGMGRLEQNKRTFFGADTYSAISAVMNASDEDTQTFGRNKVFGPLVDLIEVDPKFTTAADVTGGGNLTHIVVDNDETAARLVHIMKQKRAGRVTFIPLSRLERNHRPPPNATADAIPLVSKINCDPRFRPAVNQVFGRTMVTRSVAVANDMSRDLGCDCVTLDGDQVNRRGAMTGGYVDMSRSRIEAVRALEEARGRLRELTPEMDSLRESLGSIDSELSAVLGEVARREALVRSSQSQISRLRTETEQLTRYHGADQASIPKARERITTLEESIATTKKRLEGIDSELKTPMTSGLTPAEEAELEGLKQAMEQAQETLRPKTQQRGELERQVTTLKSELEGNLERRRTELQAVLNNDGLTQGMGASEMMDGEGQSASVAEALQKRRDELAKAEEALASVQAKISASSARIAELTKLNKSLETKLEKDREEETKVKKSIEEDRQKVETRYSHQALAKQKKAEAERKIRELGSLPADFNKYRGVQHKVLVRNLKKVNEKLNDYSHVNKKALDQFISFTEQRETLKERKSELEAGATAIRDLIESLDLKKDADILRTYKGVSRFFSEVFSELVPGGKASLVMLKSTEKDTDGRVQYSGVSMKVMFTTTGEAYLLQQLSGGQKSIVALALIFAIQRLDPAPFYLFDEIDANLDATHRQAVANLILKQSKAGTQFITTTFRPEFVNAGDKWFGVIHKKKVSTVEQVKRDVALTFITNEPAQ